MLHVPVLPGEVSLLSYGAGSCCPSAVCFRQEGWGAGLVLVPVPMVKCPTSCPDADSDPGLSSAAAGGPGV